MSTESECAGCVKASRARAAVSSQLLALHKESEAMHREIEDLRQQLATSKRNYEAVCEAALEYGVDLSGFEAEVDVDDSGHPRDRDQAEKELLGDVITDGDLNLPSKCAGSYSPNASANVVSLVPLGVETEAVLCACGDRSVVTAMLEEAHTEDEQVRIAFSLVNKHIATAPYLCGAAMPPPDTHSLTAPLTATSVDGKQWIACGGMDGSFTLYSYARSHAAALPTLDLHLRLPLHDKYLTRLAWSPCGRYLATASHDMSLCFLRVSSCHDAASAGHPVLTILQRCYFLGNVDALAWKEDCLVVAVHGMPVLYYIGLPSQRGLDTTAAIRLPIQQGDGHGITLEDGMDALRLYRVPISEDGVHVDICKASNTCVPATATVPTQQPHAADSSAAPLIDLSERGFYMPVGFSIVDVAVSKVAVETGKGQHYLAAASDNGIIFLYQWGSNTILRRLVGHNVNATFQSATRLAWHPSSSSYLLATSDRDFTLCIYSVGSGRVVLKLGIGQPVLGMALSASIGTQYKGEKETGEVSTTSVWGSSRYGHNLVTEEGQSLATSDTTDVPRQTVGHTGCIKEVHWVRPHLILSAGFDKKVLAWV
jgi:WD40 repeat protein